MMTGMTIHDTGAELTQANGSAPTSSYSVQLGNNSILSIGIYPFGVPGTIFLGALAVLASVVTVAGNLLVIASFFVERALRSSTNYFIASLAVTDLFIGVASMNLYTLYLLLGVWPLGEIFCDIWLSLDYTLCLTSQYTVFFITVDRYCSVEIPAKYRNWRTDSKVQIMVAATWILPAAIFFTTIMGWPYFTGNRNRENNECYAEFTLFPLFNTILTICYYWITLVVMIVLYAGIYRVALNLQRKSDAKRKRTNNLMSMAGQTMSRIGVAMQVTPVQSQTGKVSATSDNMSSPQSPSQSCQDAVNACYKSQRRGMTSQITSDLTDIDEDASISEETISREYFPKFKHRTDQSHDNALKDVSVQIISTKTVNMTSSSSTSKTTFNANDKPNLPRLSPKLNVSVQYCSFIQSPLLIDYSQSSPSEEALPQEISDASNSSFSSSNKQQQADVLPDSTTLLSSSNHSQLPPPPKTNYSYSNDSDYHTASGLSQEYSGTSATNASTLSPPLPGRFPLVKSTKKNYHSVHDGDFYLGRESISLISLKHVEKDAMSDTSHYDSFEFLPLPVDLDIEATFSSSPIWVKRSEYYSHIPSQRDSLKIKAVVGNQSSRTSAETLNERIFLLNANNFVPLEDSHTEEIHRSFEAGGYRVSRSGIQPSDVIIETPSFNSFHRNKRIKAPTIFSFVRETVQRNILFRATQEKVERGRSENRARKALRTISLILGAFVISWTPFHVFVLIKGFCDDPQTNYSCVNSHLFNMSYWLCYLNSPINPFCYALANAQFKKTFLRLLKGDFHRT